MIDNIEEYIDSIRHEVNNLSPEFTGNIEFKLNLREGGICNMNVIQGKSIKLVERRQDAV